MESICYIFASQLLKSPNYDINKAVVTWFVSAILDINLYQSCKNVYLSLTHNNYVTDFSHFFFTRVFT